MAFSVQDVAFQLERLVGGMYVYNRQCYKAMKQAAVFPIEVQLSIHPATQEGEEEEREGDGEGEERKGEGDTEEKGKVEPQEDLLIQTD